MKRLGVLAAIGIGGGVLFGLQQKCRSDEEEAARERREEERGKEIAETRQRFALADAAIDGPSPDFSPERWKREQRQHEIADALGQLFRTTNTDAQTGMLDDKLAVVAPRGQCNRATLDNLRKALAAMDLDPAEVFTSLVCTADGVELPLHR